MFQHYHIRAIIQDSLCYPATPVKNCVILLEQKHKCIWIRKKTLQFSSTVLYAPYPYGD